MPKPCMEIKNGYLYTPMTLNQKLFSRYDTTIMDRQYTHMTPIKRKEKREDGLHGL